ncbi:unnamed protein product [Durusdinium trenchii]|uniref:Uncharacterized protein n=1 Tax=Durusdinium trenchii TaxID=1381693 RepID=A0ABP0P5J7_9DINO
MLRTALPACPFGFRWQQWRPLVLSASQFLHILEKPDLTSQAYIGNAGHELSLLSGQRRGKILEQFCKKELARMKPSSKIEEPTEGTRCDGTRRSRYHSEYDFTMDGRKVECKSSQMSWNNSGKCWYFHFSSIKLPRLGVRDQAPFDELYLIFPARIVCTSSSMIFRLKFPQLESKQEAVVIRFLSEVLQGKNVGKVHGLKFLTSCWLQDTANLWLT